MYSEYFIAAARFLTGRNILPEISERKVCTEEELARVEVRLGRTIPAELRAYYTELGEWFSFAPERGQSGFRVAPLLDLEPQQGFAQEIMEEAEREIRSERPRVAPPQLIRAEAERRASWFPFYNIGGGGYLLCLDERQTISPERTLDTTRRRLNRVRRGTAFFIVTGSVCFFACFPVVLFSPLAAYILLGVCAAFNLIGLVIRALAGRCGHCRRRISRALSFAGWPWSISPAVRFCPYCAASIDEPITQSRNT